MNIKSITIPKQPKVQHPRRRGFKPLENVFLDVRNAAHSAARSVGDEAKQLGVALEKEAKAARNRIGAGWKLHKQKRLTLVHSDQSEGSAGEEEEAQLHEQLRLIIEQAEHDNAEVVTQLQTVCSISHGRAREVLEAASGSLERAVGIHFSQAQQPLPQRQLQQLDDESDLSAEENAAQAREQGLLIIRNHLNWFLQKNPNASYVAWIAALHPENMKMADTELREGGEVSLDSRFLIPDNPWIIIYEETAATQDRTALLAQ